MKPYEQPIGKTSYRFSLPYPVDFIEIFLENANAIINEP